MNGTLRMVGIGVLLLGLAATTAPAQGIGGCTVFFRESDVVVFGGYGEGMQPSPVAPPVEFGNVRVNRIVLPSESALGMFGLMMPWRGAQDQSALNLDTTWGAERGLTFLCEAIDPDQPIGLRISADSLDHSMRYANLALEIGPNAKDLTPVSMGKRFGNGPHRWYIFTDLQSIYGKRQVQPQFAVVLRTEGRGAISISRMVLASYMLLPVVSD